jgi:hypothetical protein
LLLLLQQLGSRRHLSYNWEVCSYYLGQNTDRSLLMFLVVFFNLSSKCRDIT